ncbi:cyclic nucleotide-binding domain-containing protein [Actinomadura chibensis]|uniref:Cyclic nucleotide-binding domain-containing protein n=1 Tax=Actinomadura chibensis TaxID=392828 RepID=A0A5D0NYS0_9ACTN|nr:cyclic nucleotide-binding domain-containing protein [Actinomadura chibensis]TYB49730.1 cyclic nucleotide-binding domain-containing protein [Actinomadura chibensis]
MDEHTRHHDPDQIVPSELDAAADRHPVRPASATEHRADATEHQADATDHRTATAPGGTRPGAAHQGTAHPRTARPTTGHPGTGHPSTGQPGTSHHRTGQPETGQPGFGHPGGGQPGAGHPGTGQPGGGQPGAGHPGTGQPGGGHPRTGQPGTNQPGSGQPGTSQLGTETGQYGGGQGHGWTGVGGQAVARRGGATVPAGGPAGGHPVLTPPLQGFWGALTETEQDALLAIAQEVVYPVGTILWAEGQAADQAVVIQAGSVRVSVNRDGHERIIAFRRPGDIIGERAALLMRRRSATIVAMGTVRGLRMTTQPFAAYLSDHPRVVDVLERELYDRLTEQSGRRQAAPYGPAAQYGYGPRNGSGMQYAPGTTHGYETAAGYTVQPGYAGQNGYAAQSGVGHTGAAGLYGQQRSYATAPMPLPPGEPDGHGTHLVPASSIPYEDDDEDKATQPMVISPSPYPSAQAGPSWMGRNCTIAYTDIAGFSASHRNDRDRLDMRRAMYRLLREAFEESGVPWSVCYLEDRGDGALIVVPPEVPTAAVVDAVIASLARRLRRHNEKASVPVRFQLRVAVHVGPVMPDPPGISGWALIRTARLLDARPLKDRLAASGADLGFIASTFVYESVIAHGPGYVNRAEYEPISCRVKKLKTEGWIHLCGVGVQSAV